MAFKKQFKLCHSKNCKKSKTCFLSFVFNLNVAWKQFSKKLLKTNFGFKQFLNPLCYILRKWFQLCHSKICKNLKNALFKGFYLRVASKPFPEMLTTADVRFKDFWMPCPPFTLSCFNFINLKCPKNWKLPFSKGSEHLFNLEVVSKPFSKMLSIPEFRFTQFHMLYLAFPLNNFNLATEKRAKKLKTPFSNAQNIRF